MKSPPIVLRISPRITLHPASDPAPTLPQGQLALPQIPSKAFGDGTHPTTRLCAGALDLLCRQSHPNSVLDVGTGTGVLARIARARGAQFIVGTDIEPEALRAARENSALDQHPVEILYNSEMPDHWGPRFNLVVANILEGPLRELAAPLASALAPKGVLLLSGFTTLQIPALRTAFCARGLKMEIEAEQDGWALLMFRKT